jgi:ABC-type multidrug transport system ATPase subunit
MDRDLAIETSDLTKRYGDRVVAVRDLGMSVRRGEIYGFLGPNGAGKTTTLRMLAGLIAPSAGSATIFGRRPGSREAVACMGALIEGPAFYPYLSGRDNLGVLASYGATPRRRIDIALERVQLLPRAGDRFERYSLGMKQRLGVAAALLKDPVLLILDEPTNGLDPAGMADMRSLIVGLGREGHTVLVSSHLMGEVEQVCDRVGIIREGTLVAEGTIDELRGRESLRVRAEPLEEAARVAARVCGVECVDAADGHLLIRVDPAAAPAINRALVQAGIAVSELTRERSSLEQVFLELTQTGGTNRDR